MPIAKTPEKQKIRCRVNGRPHEFLVFPMARLLDVLREEAQLTGTKEGCGEGECGACSIFMNDVLVNSCLVPALQANDADIQTIEGLAPSEKSPEKSPEKPDDSLHIIQKAFIEAGGAQCGICTPGMIMATVNLLKNLTQSHNQSHDPMNAMIREGLAGNICRCTGYMKIFTAVHQAYTQKIAAPSTAGEL